MNYPSLQLVNSLVDQLEDCIQLEQGAGTKYRTRFRNIEWSWAQIPNQN